MIVVDVVHLHVQVLVVVVLIVVIVLKDVILAGDVHILIMDIHAVISFRMTATA